jgi:NADH-quinone oxidoreductase subunit N
VLGSYQGLARARPWLAAALLVALLGLVGTPPTAVFVGKLTTATAAWDGGQAWLAVVVLVNTVVSLFYYLRWIVPCYQRPARDGTAEVFAPNRWSTSAALVAAGLSLGLGIAAGVVWGPLTSSPMM